MREVYYWNDKIPANPDTTLAPDIFFDSILNKYNATTNPTGDRFSWIENDAQYPNCGAERPITTTGMDYNLYLRASGSTGVIAQVLYVLPGSPAAESRSETGRHYLESKRSVAEYHELFRPAVYGYDLYIRAGYA